MNYPDSFILTENFKLISIRNNFYYELLYSNNILNYTWDIVMHETGI